LNDLFKCKNCGAPRSYINQYCPICESSGPHFPAGSKSSHSRPVKRKVNPDALWWDDVKTDEKTVINKRKETREKETMRDSFKERKASNITDDDKEMRSLWATGPSAKPISKKTWGYISIAAVAVLAVAIMALNFSAIIEPVITAKNRISAWLAYQPAPLAATVSANTTQQKPNAANNPTQSPTATENVTVKLPEPVKDTTKPMLLDKPVGQPSDTSATVTWKTDEKATSLVRYGTDTSYPFPSTEDAHRSSSHSVYITGLTPETTYHFQVISTDESGNTFSSGDYTFKTESTTNAAPYMGCTAPNFTLKTLDGTPVSLSQFRGKKVILNFWASWCSPCKIELPHLQTTWDKYKNGGEVMFLTVAGSQSEEDIIRSYMKENGYNFIVCLDSGESTFNRYEIVSIPKTYFIDKGGVIRRLQQGMFTSPGEVEFMLNSY
jgi:peroxiredoxin